MHKNLRSMILIALFAALAAVVSPLRIPLPGGVPITLQLMVALITGILLGGSRALWAQGLYLLLGLAGLPIFSEGGGFWYIAHPTFGYLLGMMLGAGLCGWITAHHTGILNLALGCVAGMLTCYIVGIPWLAGYMSIHTDLSYTLALNQAWLAGTVPFILPDLIKVSLSVILGYLLRKRLRFFNA